MLLHPIACHRWLRKRRSMNRSAENNHIEPPRRRVVDPLRRELADGVKGGEVAFLGVNEVVSRGGAEIVDAVD